MNKKSQRKWYFVGVFGQPGKFRATCLHSDRVYNNVSQASVNRAGVAMTRAYMKRYRGGQAGNHNGIGPSFGIVSKRKAA